MHIIITGCGRVGAYLAQFLAYEGHNVVVIDRDASAFNRLGSAFNGITLQGVAFDEQLLQEAGIRTADALAAVTNYDNTNMMTAEIASNIFHVPNVIARLYNPDKEQTFHKLGIEHVCGTTLLAERIKDKLLQGHLIIHYEDPQLGVKIVELTIGDESISNIHDVEKHRVITAFSGNKNVEWNAETTLAPGEGLVMVVSEEATVSHDAGCEIPPSPGQREIKVVIAGCGRVGAQLAEMLSKDGCRVTVIDKSSSSFQRLPKTFTGEVIAGYSFDEETLSRSGISEADLFAAVTNYDNANLMTAEVVKHIFGVPKVVARLYNPDKEETFEALGMDYVCGTALVSRQMIEKILKPKVNILATCCNNTQNIVEFKCPTRLAGKRVAWCEDNLRLRVAYIRRNGEIVFPAKDERLQREDEVIALAAHRRLQKLEKYIKGRTGNGR